MKSSFKIEILLVALVTVGPLVAAYVLYYGGQPRELPRLVNTERVLLDPIVELPPVDGVSGDEGEIDNVLSGPTWSLMYARTSPCTERCIEDLLRLRQVHVTLGRDQYRVRRIYAGMMDEPRVAEDPNIVRIRLDDPDGAALLDQLRSIDLAPGDEGRVYVADPHGNLVLSYPPSPDQEGLQDDLERLLSVSRIG